MMYTRAQWTTKRDAAGVKSGLVKGVGMGPMLDTYIKAGTGKNGAEASLARVKLVGPLKAGLVKYKVALAPLNKPALMSIVDEMIKTIDDDVAMGARLANPVINTKETLAKTIANAKLVMASGDATAYGVLWNTNVRGVGTTMAKLAKMDPKIKDLHQIWLPYTNGDWAAAGKHVALGINDPVAKKAKIQAAAKQILAIAMKVQSEFKVRKYWL